MLYVLQMVWKKCSLQVTPICLKLTLMQLVDRLSEETSFQPLPGVLFSSNRSRVLQETVSSRNDLPPLDRLDGLLVTKVKGYLKSLTLSFRLMDTPTINTTDIMESVVTKVTGMFNKVSSNNVYGLRSWIISISILWFIQSQYHEALHCVDLRSVHDLHA